MKKLLFFIEDENEQKEKLEFIMFILVIQMIF